MIKTILNDIVLTATILILATIKPIASERIHQKDDSSTDSYTLNTITSDSIVSGGGVGVGTSIPPPPPPPSIPIQYGSDLEEYRDSNRFIEMYNDFPRISYDTIHQILRDEDGNNGNVNVDESSFRRDDQRYRRRWKELNTFRASSSILIPSDAIIYDEKYVKNTDSIKRKREKRNSINSINTPRFQNSTNIINLTNRNITIFNLNSLTTTSKNINTSKTIQINLIHLLNLTFNQLNQFDFNDIPEKFINLQTLDLAFNNLSEFQFDGDSMDSIEILNLTNNHVGKFTTINIRTDRNEQNTKVKLKELSLRNNCLESINSINLSMLNDLEILDLSCNQIRKLDQEFLGQVKNLRRLNLSKNLLGGTGGHHHQNQNHCINCSSSSGSSSSKDDCRGGGGGGGKDNDDPTKNKKTTQKLFSHTIDEAVGNVGGPDDDEAVFKEPFYNLLNIDTLILSHNNIRFIDFETFLVLPNLQYLDLSHNMIQGESIKSLQGIPDLVGLSIAYNLDLGDSLQEFVATWSLKELDASGTGLCRIPAALAQSVRTLKLVDNWLSVINCGDLDSYPLLQYLDLSNSHVDDIEDDALGRLEMLETLFLDHNNLKRIPISLPTSLEHLFLQNNLITEIQPQLFQGLRNLRILDLSRNKLLYLPGLPLPKLLILNLQSSELKRLSQSVVKTSPKLRDLLLDDNPIKCSDLLGIAEWTSSCHEENYEVGNVGGNGNANGNTNNNGGNGLRGIDIDQNGIFVLPKDIKNYFQQRNNHFGNFKMPATINNYCYGDNFRNNDDNKFHKLLPKCANSKTKQSTKKLFETLQSLPQTIQNDKVENIQQTTSSINTQTATTTTNTNNQQNANGGQKDPIKDKSVNLSTTRPDEYLGHQEQKHKRITLKGADIIKMVAAAASSITATTTTTTTSISPIPSDCTDGISVHGCQNTTSLFNIQQKDHKENLQFPTKLYDNQGKTFTTIPISTDKNHADVASNLPQAFQTIKTTDDVGLIKPTESSAAAVTATLPTNPVQRFNLDNNNKKMININNTEETNPKAHPIAFLRATTSTSRNIEGISSSTISSSAVELKLEDISDEENLKIFKPIHSEQLQLQLQNGKQQESNHAKRSGELFVVEEEQQQRRQQLIENPSEILSKMKSDNHYVETSVLLSQRDVSKNKDIDQHQHMKKTLDLSQKMPTANSNVEHVVITYNGINNTSNNPKQQHQQFRKFIETRELKNDGNSVEFMPTTEQTIFNQTGNTKHNQYFPNINSKIDQETKSENFTSNLHKIDDDESHSGKIFESSKDRRLYGSRLLKENIIPATTTQASLIEETILEQPDEVREAEKVKRDENIDESQTKMMMAPTLNQKNIEQQLLDKNFEKITNKIDEINRSEIKRISSSNNKFNNQMRPLPIKESIKNNDDQQLGPITESATLLRTSSMNRTTGSTKTPIYLPTSYIRNFTTSISTIQSETKLKTVHKPPNNIKSPPTPPPNAENNITNNESHTRRSTDNNVSSLLAIIKNENSSSTKIDHQHKVTAYDRNSKNPHDDINTTSKFSQQHQIPPILLQGNSFTEKLHNSHADDNDNQNLLFEQNKSEIQSNGKNASDQYQQTHNQQSLQHTISNRQHFMTDKTLQSTQSYLNSSNKDRKLNENVKSTQQGNDQEQHNGHISKIVINQNRNTETIENNNHPGQNIPNTKGSSKLIELLTSLNKPNSIDNINSDINGGRVKGAGSISADAGSVGHHTDNINLNEIESLMSDPRDENANDDSIHNLLMESTQSKTYHHYSNDDDENNLNNRNGGKVGNSFNEFQLDTTNFIKLEHQKHLQKLQQLLPVESSSSSSSSSSLSTSSSSNNINERQSTIPMMVTQFSSNIDLPIQLAVDNHDDNRISSYANNDKSLPILSNTGKLENHIKVNTAVHFENLNNNNEYGANDVDSQQNLMVLGTSQIQHEEIKHNTNNTTTTTVLSALDDVQANHLDHNNNNNGTITTTTKAHISINTSNNHTNTNTNHINNMKIIRNNVNDHNGNTGNGNGLPPEQWLEIRTNPQTTGHPGLFIVIGITFGIILMLAVVHIYRCHRKPSWYYGHHHRQHNHQENYGLQHNCNRRRRHHQQFKSNDRLNSDGGGCCSSNNKINHKLGPSALQLTRNTKFNTSILEETHTCANCNNDNDYYIEMDQSIGQSESSLNESVAEQRRDLLPMELLRSPTSTLYNQPDLDNIDMDNDDFDGDIDCPRTSVISGYSKADRRSQSNRTGKRYW